MVLSSTFESIRSGQISLLAIIETLIATGVSIFLCIHYNTATHIVGSAMLAPFLLMRTPESQQKLLVVAEKVSHFCYSGPANAFFEAVLAIPILVLTKVFGTIYYVLRHPISSIRIIPENWRKVVFCTDTATLPEFLPGIEEEQATGTGSLAVLRVSALVHDLTNLVAPYPRVFWPLVGILHVACLVLVYSIAIAYRWSLKSTALIWSPLLWILRPNREIGHPLQFSRGIINLGFHKLGRAYSALVLIMFTTKLYVLIAWSYLGGFLTSNIAGWKVVEAYVVPNTLAFWQIAAAINAFLTWWIWLRATQYVHEREGGVSEPSYSESVLEIVFIVRNTLSIYTSLCILYITFKIAMEMRPIPLYLRFFPW